MVTHFSSVSTSDFASWIGARITGPVPATFRYLESDTRNLNRGPGGLFIALKGALHDGHDFVLDALNKYGAVAAVVSAEWALAHESLGLPLLAFDGSVWEQLCAAVRKWRENTDIPVIGITGSAGKTTTRELLASALNSDSRRIFETENDLNGGYDTLLTALQTPPQSSHLVLEMGIRFPGAMNRRAGAVRPDIGILTSIGTAHLGNFGTREKLADEKIRMLQLLSGKSTSFAVVSREEAFIDRVRARTTVPLIEVSLVDDSAPYYGHILDESTASMEIIEKKTGIHTTLALHRPGRHLCADALLAFACARELGTPPQDCARGMESFSIPGERWKKVSLRGASFIDDSYNSNPAAAKAVLDAFSLLPGRKIAVLGDMLELGSYAEELHRDVGVHAAKTSIDAFVTVGPFSARLADEIDAIRPGEKVIRTSDATEAQKALFSILKEHDTVLLKGSHGMHLSTILTNSFPDGKTPTQNSAPLLTPKDLIRQELRGFGSDVTLLADDFHGSRISVGATDCVIEAASTIKVFILAALYDEIRREKHTPEEELVFREADRAPGSGVLKNIDAGARMSVRSIATLMISVSDNSAANMLIELLGLEAINEWIADSGFPNTRLHGKILPGFNKVGTTTPVEFLEFFVRLAQNKLLGAPFDSEIIRILETQQLDGPLSHEIPRCLAANRNPSLVRIASKTGTMPGVKHEGGIVSTPYGRYAIVIMARNCPVPAIEPSPVLVPAGRAANLVLQHYLSLKGHF